MQAMDGDETEKLSYIKETEGVTSICPESQPRSAAAKKNIVDQVNTADCVITVRPALLVVIISFGLTGC